MIFRFLPFLPHDEILLPDAGRFPACAGWLQPDSARYRAVDSRNGCCYARHTRGGPRRCCCPDTVAAATTPAPAAAPAASATQNLTVSFSFKPGPAGPDRKTAAHLVVKGGKGQDIDLGQFSGKPDVVTKEKAKLAGFPGDMLMGFRSYDPGSGTSYDLAVMNVGGNTLRIVQRKVEESADKTPEFQTSREVPLPANSVVQVAPAKK
ncbi:hypothetical protein [Hymenobacter cellulosilyticus]|uniref:Uncharacterized protein n=1 Tax=Hymenobacter cellulosilyticus TaxID=2932248 RepID=A0A8T9Q1Y3_9BACT|nr:hypothetical protein [Hymenobacter cellulosilyticus]UOQ71514.1 hypothetical protein MUN79_23320 [Hymenobacter cellulosilyticus]